MPLKVKKKAEIEQEKQEEAAREAKQKARTDRLTELALKPQITMPEIQEWMRLQMGLEQ